MVRYLVATGRSDSFSSHARYGSEATALAAGRADAEACT